MSEAAVTVREASRGLLPLNLGEIWRYRELLFLLVWRNTLIRYKQTVVGVGWALIKPVVSMVVFSLVFGRLAGIPSDGVPYPVFAYAALLPWTYFAGCLTGTSGSLVSGSSLLTKVYFPRLILPLSELFTGLVDFLLSGLVLAGMLVVYRDSVHVRTWGLLCLPLFLLMAMACALAFGLWLTALSARYRDVQHLMPFVIQVWFFLTPVVYPTSLVPSRWRILYALNPMNGVIEGFRWALLGRGAPDASHLAASGCVILLILAGGLYYFRRTERNVVDIL